MRSQTWTPGRTLKLALLLDGVELKTQQQNGLTRVKYQHSTDGNQARREPQRGPGKHYRGALPPTPHSVCLEIETPWRRQEGGNVGRGVPSPSD